MNAAPVAPVISSRHPATHLALCGQAARLLAHLLDETRGMDLRFGERRRLSRLLDRVSRSIASARADLDRCDERKGNPVRPKTASGKHAPR